MSESREETPRFLSEDEIVRDYIESLKPYPEALEKWMNAKREDVQGWHWGAGMWIRNQYRLWDRENPLTQDFGNGPEAVSERLLERIWDELHDEAKPG